MNLPHAASVKLTGLVGQGTDARDQATSAQRRIEEIRGALRYSDTPPANADELRAEMERLTAVRDKANIRAGELQSLTGNINLWLRRLGPNVAFEQVRTQPKVKLEAGESIAVALARIRDQITAVQSHLGILRMAPLPHADQKKAARDKVAQMAAKGRPTIKTDRGTFSLSFDSGGYAMSSERVVELLAWMFEAQMVKLIETQLAELPEPKHAISAAEKARRLAELTTQLDKLEHTEESLIEQALGDGLDILRRANASPLAVLGLMQRTAVKSKSVEAQVA